MKHVQKFAAALFAMAVVGCGGSGNGSAPKVIPFGAPRMEAIVKVLRTNLQHPNNWTDAQLANPQTPGLQADLINPTAFGIQDPTNIECNEQMVFQVVNYSPDGTRNILAATQFMSSDATGVYGTLSANSGDYLAGNSPTTAPLSVSGIVNGVVYSTFYDIKVDQVRLLGSVLAQGTNANQLAGTLVQFFDTTGALVDTVTVQSDGTIRASVPTVAASFTVVADTIPGTFYHSFNYLGLQYDAGNVSCFAALPNGLASGTTTLPGVIYITPRVNGQPTPPPTGCSDAVSGSVNKKKA
jgi:hypothetical protein